MLLEGGGGDRREGHDRPQRLVWLYHHHSSKFLTCGKCANMARRKSTGCTPSIYSPNMLNHILGTLLPICLLYSPFFPALVKAIGYPIQLLCYKQYWTALSLHHMLTERHITLPFITVKHSPVTRLQLTYSFCGHLLWHF